MPEPSIITIKKSEVMWRFYKRFYQGYVDPPHPQNLCRFFWRAILGFLMLVTIDLPWYLVLPASIFGIYNSIMREDYFITLPISIFFMISSGYNVSNLVMDNPKYGNILDKVSKFMEALLVIVFSIGVISFLALIASLPSWESGKTIHQMNIWWLLFIGLRNLVGILFGMVLVLCFVKFCQGDSSIARVTKNYLKALKQKYCPLVKIED